MKRRHLVSAGGIAFLSGCLGYDLSDDSDELITSDRNSDQENGDSQDEQGGNQDEQENQDEQGDQDDLEEDQDDPEWVDEDGEMPDSPTPITDGDLEEQLHAYMEEHDAIGYSGEIESMSGSVVEITVGANDVGHGFSHPAISISQGTTVRWDWSRRGLSHYIAGDPSDLPQYEYSELVDDPDHSVEFEFDEPGLYLYICRVHGPIGGVGAIIVD